MSLKENHYYHIYNRGINSTTLFNDAPNYQRFLASYEHYCFLTLDTFAYCLLNNHFHFLVKVRSAKEQERLFYYHQQQNLKKYNGLKFNTFKLQNSSTQLGHLFNSYTRYFNVRNDVTGPRFEGRFKRIEVDTRQYRAQLACYIHRNPIHHQITPNYEDYPWSSYAVFFEQGDHPFINKEEVYRWLGGADGFKAAHAEMKLKLDTEYLLE